jgi:serine O-acetyltransferase
MRPKIPDRLWSLSRRLHSAGWPSRARIVKTLNYYFHGCLLPAEAQAGENLVLEHYGLGVVIHPQVIVGNNCRIYHHVTLASESCIGSEHFIILDDDVVIGAHSILIARPNSTLRIGKGAVVGAGSVVTKNVPAGEVWAGNPAKFLRTV